MEFGSDFHYISGDDRDMIRIHQPNALYFADGRMTLQHLILYNSWKRIWIPQFFCYDVVDSVMKTGIEICFYPDFPQANDEEIISKIVFRKDDVLLRMNYFGLRSVRDNSNLPIDVIEDHSHGINTNWALNSNAAYCIASLRKTIPIPEGGMIWSVNRNNLPLPLPSNEKNDVLTLKRHYAMYKKTMYIKGYEKEKEEFRKLFMETEEEFGLMDICGMSNLNEELFLKFDSYRFDLKKKNNWLLLSNLLDHNIDFLKPESEECIPFSMVLKFDDLSHRNLVRTKLLKNNVYPAILWPIPDEYWTDDMPILLSLHCDGRYNSNEIKQLANIINHAF